jgi:hypothetical protein
MVEGLNTIIAVRIPQYDSDDANRHAIFHAGNADPFDNGYCPFSARPGRVHRVLRLLRDVDVAAVRMALPFRAGGILSKELKDQASATVKRVTS